ncbi:MAG: hypothetical protein R2940_16680 [Syntrophotaleaceae bacterium]
MAEKSTFGIRRAFQVPLGLLLVSQASMLGIGIVRNQAPGRLIAIGVIVLLLAGLFTENLFRRIVLDQESITAFRWFRRRILRFSDLTALEAVVMRKRVFTTLWVDDRFLLISNAYERFPALLAALVNRAPKEAVAEEALRLAGDPPRYNGHVFFCWVALLFSLLILWQQLTGHF